MPDHQPHQSRIPDLLTGRLGDSERAELLDHLDRCETCRREMRKQIKGDPKLSRLFFEETGPPENQSTNRLLRLSALILIIGGWACLAGYGIYEFIRNPGELFIPKIGAAAMIVGGVFLFAMVLFNRIRTYKKDPYKEVER